MDCNINNFCYVCGHFTPQFAKHGYFTDEFKCAYEKYFNQPIIFNVSWAPNVVCKKCYSDLLNWMHKRIKCLPFGIPMIWSDPIEHSESKCYACKNFVGGMNRKKMKNKVYVEVSSAQTPIQHSEIIPVPRPPSPEVSSGITIESDFIESFSLCEFGESLSNTPILITQTQLDFIVAKLELSQRKSEVLAQFLNTNHLLAPGTKVTAFRKRQSSLQNCFVVNDEKTYSYCKDIEELMSEINITYKADEWRLFIDSSKTSLKAVLLHQHNSKPSVPIAYSTEIKENYEVLQKILQNIQYNKHKWKICCDLKVVAFLCGLQAGYIKHMCFICDWDSRYKGDQYSNHTWQERELSKHGNSGVIQKPLVPHDKVLLPPLHIKLGIVKNFLKNVAKREEVKVVLSQIFPRLSESKLKEGVVNGPDIRKLLKSQAFNNVLNEDELIAWCSIEEVIKGLLGKNRSEGYQRSVQTMMTAFSKIGVNMSLKIHFLHHHLDYFSRQLATESDEQGERYHQIAIPFEIRYRGKKSPDAVLAEICWWSKNLFLDQIERDEDNGASLENEAQMDSTSKDEDEDTQILQLPSTSKRLRVI